MTAPGEIIDGRTVSRDLEELADFVVVGSGAAGATVARTLARAGFEVVLLEEGEWLRKEDYTTPVTDVMTRLFRDGGSQVAQGRAFMPILQGRCVGGSTVINSAIVWRLPEDVYGEWEPYGITHDIPLAALEENFAQIERDLSARRTDPAAQGPANLLMELGARRLGLQAAPTMRYENGCRGSGRCLQGCPHDAKQSMALTYVPDAIAHGARLYYACRVDRVLRANGRAYAVAAAFNDPRTGRGPHRLLARARHGVIIAASAVQTPELLRRSGVRRGGVGDHFQAHPGIPCFALFDSPRRVWLGATQGYDADHYRRSDRFKVEVLNLPPEMVLTRMPGIGRELVRHAESFDRMAIWVTQNRLEAQGTVRPRRFTVGIKYSPTSDDMVRVRKGLKVTLEMMFAAGARAVFPSVHGLPVRMTSPDDLSKVDVGPLDPRAYTWLATHLFGTARMGMDPRTSVVGTDFQVHEAPGLYVVDSSVFPTNLGVNPQHTIMAMSMLAAQKLRRRFDA